jgi:hypothetical protein
MKSFLKSYSLSFVLALFVAGPLFAGDEGDLKVEKQKTYSKSYAVSSSDRISFDNRFGELKITTWDKNEVKVDITMIGKANTEDVAQEVLDRISIDDGKNGSGVYFTTRINDNKNWPKGNKYNNTGFTINYVVYMPSRNPLTAENEFGKTIIPDYSGEITVKQKFGQLTAGKLSNVKRIHVEFSGGSTIESVNGGELDIRFSRTEINEVKGKVKAFFEHNGGLKLGLSNELTDLTVKNNFTSLYLDAHKNLSASFAIHTNFSELENKSSFSIKEEGDDEDRRGPKFDHDYSGKSGSGNVPVKVKSEFGQVIIGHNIPFDAAEKGDKKDKKKVKTV